MHCRYNQAFFKYCKDSGGEGITPVLRKQKEAGRQSCATGAGQAVKRDKLTAKFTKANKNIKTKGKDARRGRAGGGYGKEISGI